MFFRQILHDDLACASYVLADEGAAAIVDPKWEIGEYLQAAADAGAEIRYVLETHTHADHVSGRRRLLDATEAVARVPGVSADGRIEPIGDGDMIEVGRVEIRALAAPGHRPEHTAYVVYDGTADASQPRLLLSGDSLLIGDVARPDLAVAAEDGAAALFESLRGLLALGDQLELWPAHVGGSLCGSGTLSLKTSSTIGYERRTNPLLGIEDRRSFVSQLTRSKPTRPPTVKRVVELNRAGATPPPSLAELGPADLRRLVDAGVTLLDVRAPETFDAGHLAGSLNAAAAGTGLGTRAGWVASPESRIVIVASTFVEGEEASARLYAAGVWNLAGVTVADPASWRSAGLSVRTSDALTPERVAAALTRHELRLLDVREPHEWRSGHVPDSLHLPLARLGHGQDVPIPHDGPLAVACAAGRRAALAASVLRRGGYEGVYRVSGGIPDLASHGIALVNGD